MIKNISFVVMAIASIIFVALYFDGLNIKKEGLKNSVMLSCGQLYRYTETLPNGAVVSYPMVKEYQECLTSN